MGLIISELLSGPAAVSGEPAGPARTTETKPDSVGVKDQFSHRLQALLQQLRNNKSQDGEVMQRQVIAVDAAAGDAAEHAEGLLANVAAPTVHTADVAPAKSLLEAVPLGSALNVIQPVQQAPDLQSLVAFAQSQGMDSQAIRWLFAPLAPETTAVLAATRPSHGAISKLPVTVDAVDMAAQTHGVAVSDTGYEAMAQGDSRFTELQALAAQAIELLRHCVFLQDVPQPRAAATRMPLSVSLTEAMSAALDAATLITTSQTDGDTLPLQVQAREAPTQQALSPTQGAALEELRHDARQALMALIATLSNSAAASSRSVGATLVEGRGGSPAQTDPQVMAHQAMVFVRAAAHLQRSQIHLVASAVAAATLNPSAPVRTVEIDLIDAWIGSDLASTTHERIRAQQRTTTREAVSIPLSTTLALSKRLSAQDGSQIHLVSIATAASTSTDPKHQADHPAVMADVDRDLLSHGSPLQPLEDLSRQKSAPLANTATPSSYPTGNRQQDPHRGQTLVDRMGEAVAQRLLQAVDRGEWFVKLALRPAHLGEVEVQMRMHAGGLEAQFQASQAVTRELLSDGLQRLRDSLVHMGMDVAQLNVGGGRSQQRGGDSTPRQAAAAKTAKLGVTEESDATEQPIASRLPRASGWDMLA